MRLIAIGRTHPPRGRCATHGAPRRCRMIRCRPLRMAAENGARLADLGEGPPRADGRARHRRAGPVHSLRPGSIIWLPGVAVELAYRINDRIAETCARHPDRFQGFAALPTPDPEAAPRELERRSSRRPWLEGRAAVRSDARPAPRPFLFPPRCWLKRRNCACRSSSIRRLRCLRCATPIIPGSTSAPTSRWPPSALGWHYEAGLQWVRMAAAGVFDELPDLQIILGHWGEVVLFYLERISTVFDPRARPAASASRTMRVAICM